jgi:F0F1-type ATP synthase beta subunit
MSILCGIGERCREGEQLYSAMKAAGVLQNMVMVYGQMIAPVQNWTDSRIVIRVGWAQLGDIPGVGSTEHVSK